MPSSAMIAIVFLAFLRVVTPLKVIAGDTIDFQCVTEKRDNVEYLPNFERKNNDDTWTTLFVGSNPRPDTNLSKWKVNVDEKSVFHYRLLNADLEDGGHYRCENVNTNHHPLNVFSPILDCDGGRGRGDSAANIFVDDVQSFRPVCRVQTSGPLSLEEEEEEDAVSSPALKWVLGGEERVESKTRSNSSHVEAVLTKQLSEEHHGKVISCVLDAGISSEKEDRPNCVLGPLNISFDVRVKSSRDNHRDNCHYYDLILTGNPSPILQFVTIEDSTGAVQSGISYADATDNADAADAGKTPERRGIAAEPEVSPQQQPTSDGDVAVHLRACDLESSVIAAVLYEGVEVTTLTFTTSGSASGSDDGKPILVDAAAAETAGPVGAIVAAIVVILVISGIVAGVLYFVVRRKEAAKKVDEDVESGEGNGGVGGEVAGVEEVKEGVEEVKEGVEEKVEEKVVEKKESRDDEKSSSKNEEDAAEIIVDSDADAAALKAKLSEVEESESDAVLNAKLSALEDVEGVKMIDDSLNEGKEEESSLEDKDKVEV